LRNFGLFERIGDDIRRFPLFDIADHKEEKMKRRFSVGALALIVAFAVLPVTGLFAATPADQLIIGMSMNNLLSLDPAAATGLDVAMVNANLYDMLLELDPDSPSTMLPAVAESWKVAPDGGSITFVIRKGIKFQSGNPLTAEDVAWSLRRVLKLNMSLASAWKVYGFSKDTADESFRAIDPYTFVVKMPKPTDPKLILFNLGSSPSAFILDSKKVLENQKNNDMGNAWLTTNAAGSGPFKLDDWRAKDALIMKSFRWLLEGACQAQASHSQAYDRIPVDASHDREGRYRCRLWHDGRRHKRAQGQ